MIRHNFIGDSLENDRPGGAWSSMPGEGNAARPVGPVDPRDDCRQGSFFALSMEGSGQN